MAAGESNRPGDLEQILAAVAEKQPGALDQLLSAYRKELLAYVRLRFDRRLSARFDPSDVVQEVQVVVAERIDDYLRRRPMPFPIWLRKTALERLANLRKHHTRQRRTLHAEEAVPQGTSLALMRSLADPRRSPSQIAAAAETNRQVLLALAELPEIDREILVMRQLEGEQFKAIAQILDIDPAAARKRFGRALLKLKNAMNQRGLID